MRIILLSLFLLLVGCSTVQHGKDEHGYAWQLENLEIPEGRWTVVETNDVFLRCAFSIHADACSVRHVADDGELSCTIYLPDEETPNTRNMDRAALLRHEQLHCRGWEHPRWDRL